MSPLAFDPGLMEAHAKAFDAAKAHADRCRKCLVPIIRDDEGNPGLLSEACGKGRTLLRALVDAEAVLLSTPAKAGREE